MASDPCDIPASNLENCQETLNVSAYELFVNWQELNEVNSFAEPVISAYFLELSTEHKASILWDTYSMLKRTIISKHNIDISNYSRLITFLKDKSYGSQSQKSKVFTADELNKFLLEAPDVTYLAVKTVLVLGVVGLIGADNIANIKIDYVKDNGNEIIVKIPNPKTDNAKVYVVDGQYAEIVRKYMKLRPPCVTDRFFMQYRNGSCINQVVSRDIAKEMPREIAKFLNLPDYECYNGHSFRKTTTTILSESNVAIKTLKRHGTVADDNVQESLEHKSLMGEAINSPSTSNVIVASQHHENESKKIITDTVTSSDSVEEARIIEHSLATTCTLSVSQKVATAAISENDSLSENEGYVKESLGHKRKIGSLIEETINLPSTSNAIDASQHHKNGSQRVTTASVTSPESSSVVNEGIIEESLTTACTMLVSQKIVTAAASENDDSLAAIEAENSTFVPVKKLYAHRDAFKEGIPEKSYNRYVNNYETFVKWQELKEAKISFAEPVLLDYFREMSEIKQPTSLWSTYSMLKTTMFSKQNIDISGYKQLVAFLKKNSDGCQSKMGKLFTADDINKFMDEAPDDKYLAMKNLLVFGVIGARKVGYLANLTIDQVKDYGNKIILTTAYPISKSTKEYVIQGQYAEAVRKYMQLRPRLSSTDRFFMQYRNGRCRDQVIGKNTLYKMPKEIAKFLKLPEYEAYTGYSFRTTTIIPVDTGVGMKTQHVQLKSSKIAEENVQESLGHKRNFRTLTAEETSSPSTSSESSSFEQDDISENSSLSESEEPSESNDKTALKRHQRTKASRHKRTKKPKIQEEMNWYDEECLTQIKLTTDMFKRSANMGEDYKMKILSEFSIYRIELFKKYFAAMNTVAINPINTQTTAASINTTAENGRVASSDFEFVKVEPLDNTNDINQR